MNKPIHYASPNQSPSLRRLFNDAFRYLPGVITPDGLLPIEPFTIEDGVAITVMMAWRFGGCGGSELQYAAALQALMEKYDQKTGWLIFNGLFPQNDPGAEVTIPSGDRNVQTRTTLVNLQFDLPSSIGQVYQRYVEAKGMIDQLFDSLGIPTKFGSNAWMVSPSKSKSGNALQVGGPQMGLFNTPNSFGSWITRGGDRRGRHDDASRPIHIDRCKRIWCMDFYNRRF